MEARDLMSSPPITISEHSTLEEAAKILFDRNIGCLPVVNDRSEITGIVTESDFSAKEKGIPFSLCRFPQVLGEWIPEHGVEKIYSDARTLPITEIMHREVVTVTPETPLETVLERMLEKHVHRIPVVDGKRPVGIISRRDLLKLMLARLAPAQTG